MIMNCFNLRKQYALALGVLIGLGFGGLASTSAASSHFGCKDCLMDSKSTSTNLLKYGFRENSSATDKTPPMIHVYREANYFERQSSWDQYTATEYWTYHTEVNATAQFMSPYNDAATFTGFSGVQGFVDADNGPFYTNYAVVLGTNGTMSVITSGDDVFYRGGISPLSYPGCWTNEIWYEWLTPETWYESGYDDGSLGSPRIWHNWTYNWLEVEISTWVNMDWNTSNATAIAVSSDTDRIDYLAAYRYHQREGAINDPFTGIGPVGYRGIDFYRTVTLASEYTDTDLRNNMLPIMPSYPSEWASGSGEGAWYALSADHLEGTGQRSLYRFKIPDSRTNETYRIQWKEVTTFGNGGKAAVKKMSEDIEGTGNPTNFAYGAEHEMLPPEGEGTTKVTDVRVYIVPKPAPPAGSGGGGGGFGGGGGIGGGGVLGSGGGGFYAGGCGNCGSGSGGGHDEGGAGEDEASYGVSLGGMSDGRSAGFLSFSASRPNAGMYSPGALEFSGNSTECAVLPGLDGNIRQVLAPQALVDVVSNSPSSYQMRFFHIEDVGSIVNGLYQTSGVPYVVWTIANPNTSTTNDLQITESRDGETVKQWNYSAGSSDGDWTVSPMGGGIFATTTSTNWVEEINFSPVNFRMVSLTRSNAQGVIAFQSRTTYRQFDWGEAVATNSVGSPSDPHDTVYTYYENPSYAGGTVVPLQSVTYPDGSWEYHDQSDTEGRPTASYSSFGDEPLSNHYYGRASYYDYNPITGAGDDGTISPNSPRSVSEYVGGQLISTRYTVFQSIGETLDVQCTANSANWNDSSNLITTNRYYTSGPNLYRLKGVYRTDGTGTLFDYGVNAGGTIYTNIVISGALDSSGNVTAGTRTVSLESAEGHPISTTIYNVANGLTINQTTYGNPDDFGRPQSVTHLDNTTEWTLYSPCCGVVGSSTNREGVATTYIYDGAKRMLGYARNGIIYSNLLDAAGQVLQSVRVGSNNWQMVLSKSGYDTAGHLVAETNALGGVTSYGESADSETGGLIRTTTYPDTGTRVEYYYLDGSLKRVMGTAVQPVGYGFATASLNGFYCTVTIQTNLNTDGTPTDEWTMTYTDPVGRTVRTEYSGATGASESFYNAKGQLERTVDPDDNTTWYEYNDNGELETTVVDVDGVGSKDINGPDRVTRTASDYTTLSGGSWNGVAVRRSRTWQKNDANQEVLAGEHWSSVDGLRSASIAFGVTNQSVTEYPGSAQRRVTSTAPDGTSAVSLYQNGLLQSVTRKDTGGNQLGATTYGYDAHLRVNKTTDARNGATTMGYNNADQVTSTSAQGKTTSTEYNTSLRGWRITHPDGGKVTNEFYPTGLLKKTSGVRTYPVEYTYDHAGRMQTMKTWTNYPTSGAAVTTWVYDGDRGWLAGKYYANPATGAAQTSSGVTYTYTDAGRLESRTWTRGVTTTYDYNGAGDLISVEYDDGTTPSVGYGYDRQGRQTTVTNAGSLNSTRFFNDAGQMTSESFTAGPLSGISVTNVFDALLRRTSVSINHQLSTINSASYSYSATSGRLDTVGDGAGHTATYTYVANSMLVSNLVFKQGSTTRMTTTTKHDLLNRIERIDNVPNAAASLVDQYYYNNASQRWQNLRVRDSATHYLQYEYDTLGQVTSGKRYANGVTLAGQQFEYAFDTIGNRKQARSGGDTNSANLRPSDYTVNLLNQYASRTVPGYVNVLGEATNAATVTVNKQATTRQGSYYRAELTVTNTSVPLWVGLTNVAVLNQGTNVDLIATNIGNLYVPAATESFAHDADGNLTNDGRFSYTWDAENRALSFTRISSAPSGSKVKLDCTYDPQWRRTQKIVSTWDGSSYQPSTTNKFVYDGWNLLAILDHTNGLVQSFVWGTDASGTMQGAGGVGGLISMTVHQGTNTGTYFYCYDGNYNVAALVNASNGVVAGQWEYDPFLGVIRATGPLAYANPFLGSTKYYDWETGCYYYGYRYYDPSTGRWLSRDPIQERGGKNLCAFVNNAPLNSYDPDGRITIERSPLDSYGPGKLGQCSEFTLFHKIGLSKRPTHDGYLVQHLKIRRIWWPCDSKSKPMDTTFHLWERLITVDKNDPTSWYVTDQNTLYYNPGRGKKEKGKGIVIVERSVSFYDQKDTGDLETIWSRDVDGKRTSNGMGGALGPDWWYSKSDESDPTAYNTYKIGFNCCCVNQKVPSFRDTVGGPLPEFVPNE
jgi:RHS repeat-associated protein